MYSITYTRLGGGSRRTVEVKKKFSEAMHHGQYLFYANMFCLANLATSTKTISDYNNNTSHVNQTTWVRQCTVTGQFRVN